MQATGVLHQALLDRIYQIDWPSYITRDKAIAFLQSLTRKRHMENTHTHEYTDMAYVYLVQKLGKKYRDIMKPLLQCGILQSTGYYRPGWYNDEMEYVKGQCLSYRINPELLDDQVVKVVYKGDKKHQKCRDEVTMTSKRIMRQIRIPDMNSRELINFVKRSLSDERILRQLKVNDQIQDPQVHIKGHAYPIPLDKVQRRSKDLIKDGKYCHIDHLDVYIKRKRRHLTQAYCDQLLRLKHRNVYADRNDTNLRLDSNLTNLKSDYLSLLTIDDQRLSQIDLKNSQFRFFVMLLEQCERQIMFGPKRDANLFTELLSAQTAKSEFKVRLKGGKEIEYIQKIYWTETGQQITRTEAKKLMFTVAFSSYRYCPIGKKVLQKHLPSIIAVIDGFKKARVSELSSGEFRVSSQEARDKGNASFAVMLQQVESVVFVDKILAECHNRSLKVLSKHDSIICRQCDKRHVTGIICRIMNQLFGKATYSLDVDGEVFTIPKKRKSRLGRVATEVVHTLFGVAYQSNAPPESIKNEACLPNRQELIINNERMVLAKTQSRKENRSNDLYTGSVALYPTAPKTGSDPIGSNSDKIKSERVRRLRDRIMGKG